ncbi:SOSS complex subunit B1-B [Dermatophagoides farinae]|nr:SOSS complex subunit B1-B-like [Dermatophagoides farinae]XP_046915559.1 SOSS complex subunit B1-B-like [Dermatophagoides farinae]
MGYSINHINMADKIESIKDLKPQMSKINLIGIVIEVVTRYLTKDNHDIRLFRIADRTGTINVCIYDEPGTYIQTGDICRLTRCYTSTHKGSLTVYLGRNGKITKIGEFCMSFVESPNMSEPDPSYQMAAMNS